MEKESWLNKKINLQACREVKSLVKDLELNTVCQKAMCPNISECFKRNVATFMILGDICTRKCSFCGVDKRTPLAVNEDEVENIARAVEKMQLSYVVITSPTRDDLKDFGSDMFAKVVARLREVGCVEKIELLIPDFCSDSNCLQKVIDAKPDVIGHNMETVKRLYPQVRSSSDYKRSLNVLWFLKRNSKDLKVKSSIMVGLGETEDEVIELLSDVKKTGCDFFSIGQYLSPSRNHYPVKEYISLDKFAFYERKAKQLGFQSAKSAPYVRSSYLADTYWE